MKMEDRFASTRVINEHAKSLKRLSLKVHEIQFCFCVTDNEFQSNLFMMLLGFTLINSYRPMTYLYFFMIFQNLSLKFVCLT